MFITEKMTEFIKRKPNDSKKTYLEIMRIIAAFFVIFNHTGYYGFLQFFYVPTDSFKFWIYCFISVFSKFSVFLFLMISGALLLGKEEPASKLCKRIFRTVIALILISFFYYIKSIGFDFNKFEIITFITNLYSGSIKYNLWYLYLYIGFLISLPFLRAMVKNLKKTHYYYMAIVGVIINAIIPIAQYFIWKGNAKINTNVKEIWIVGYLALYPCIGYFLQNKIKINIKMVICTWIVNILTIALTCCTTYFLLKTQGNVTQTIAQAFFSCFAIVSSTCVFVTIKYAFENTKFNNIITRIINSMGECSYGIYLFHPLFLDSKHVIEILQKIRDLGINRLISAFIWCGCIFIMCYVITYILKKIPGLKKIL